MGGIAIIGAAGFLGGHLLRGFEARSARVHPLVRAVDARSPAGARTFADAVDHPDILEGAEVVVLAAGASGAETTGERSVDVERVAQAMRMASAARARRFVLISSTAVYGFPARLPVTEDHPYAPRTALAAVKVEVEMRARRAARELGLELVIARPTSAYGPGARRGLVDRLASAIQLGVGVGPGDNAVHLTHVDDVVEGVWLAATHPDAGGQHVILAGPEVTTLRELTARIAVALDRPPPSLRVPSGLARAVAIVVDVAANRGLSIGKDPRRFGNGKLDAMTLSIAFDGARARQLLGFVPRVGYDEGIARTFRGDWPELARIGAPE
jgi:nucleoside-diphosphate-sugar epimerase